MKTKILALAIIAILAIVVISCEKDDEAPEFKIASIKPAASETNVKYDTKVVISFSRKLSTQTASGSGFSLTNKSGVLVPVTASYDGASTMTYTPSVTLDSSMEYKVELKGATAEDKTILSDYVSTFTVEKIPLKIISIEPANKATGVSINASVVITFNKAVASPSFGFGAEMQPVSVRTSLSADRKVFTVTPKEPMKKNTLYGIVLTGPKAIDGDVMPETMSEFTTEK